MPRPLNVGVGVAMIVQRGDGKVLMSRRLPGRHGAGQWQFPGGWVEHGEPPEVAAKRETLEEAGVIVGRCQLFCASTTILDDGTASEQSVVMLVYRAKPFWWVGEPQELEDGKHSAWSWRDLRSALEDDVFGCTGPALQLLAMEML